MYRDQTRLQRASGGDGLYAMSSRAVEVSEILSSSSPPPPLWDPTAEESSSVKESS